MITLLTDFGTDSAYVAEMKGVLFSMLDERTTIVDLTHSILPQNIPHGAVVWRDTIPTFPDGSVHIGVVDPGVGTERRILAAKLRIDGKTATFVCPDNGLISLLLDDFAPIETVHLTESRFWRKNVSRTFHGRDIMAPVAAAIVSGEPLRNLGEPAAQPIRLELPIPIRTETGVRGMVLFIDAFGNVITNLVGEDFSEEKILKLGSFELQRVETYGDAVPGSLVLLVGSSDRLEIAAVNGSAARLTGLKPGEHFDIIF